MNNLQNKEPLIFIADDSQIFLYLISGYLKRNGYENVRTFTDGETLLANLHLNPSAIILDYYFNSENKMAISGKTVLRVMKENSYSSPVLLVTNNEKPEQLNEILELGAVAFLSKKDDEIISKIESFLNDIVKKNREPDYLQFVRWTDSSVFARY